MPVQLHRASGARRAAHRAICQPRRPRQRHGRRRLRLQHSWRIGRCGSGCRLGQTRLARTRRRHREPEVLVVKSTIRSFDLAHLAHVELLSPKPEESLRFFTDVMGMTESGRRGESVYLRGWDDYEHHTLKLTASTIAGMGHMAFRATSPEALDRRVRTIEQSGAGKGWTDGDLGHGPAYAFETTDDHYGARGRFHHVTYAIDCREDVLRAADIFLENGVHIETGPHKHAIQQTFFLYVYEPGGNRVEVANAGARLVLAPDWQPVIWTEADRKKGQAWGLKTIETFHTHGTPPIDQYTGPRR